VDRNKAKEAVKMLVEGFLREEIANTSLEELMKDRDNLRQSIIKKVQNKAKGWGIWIETIEITELKIMSRSLFEDLQAEFRTKLRVDAEADKMASEMNISIQKLESEEVMHKNKTEKNMRTKIADLEQRLKKKKMDLTHTEKEVQSRKQKMQSNHNLRKKEIELNNKTRLDKTKKDLENKAFVEDKEVQRKKDQINELKNEKEEVIAKRKIEMTLKSLDSMYIAKMDLNNYTKNNGLVSLFPQLTNSK